ncbi:hypothetical protein FOA43_000110 [Brettanomyces nanus]|uniref:Small ribosomal subunit protein uS11m n=1 Tax=Eeniella nana TaxID=13502 RepID=A0A875RWH0_EENNA|nr:uncharacterized protein FOA43_000110 [Brettanomyces nanus]QPG72808.1 hypothetical protein FOA43_000110 [Brettanomyces nanus]
MLKNISRVRFNGLRAFSTFRSLLNELTGNNTFGSILGQESGAGNSRTIPQSSTITANTIKTKKNTNMKTLKHILHCKFRKNNTFLTLTKVEVDMNYEHNNPNESFNEKVLYYLTLPQKVILSQSTGYVGFRKAQRGEYEASFQLTSHIFKLIRERHMLEDGQSLEIVVREFGKGRKAFFDALKGKEGMGIRDNVTKLSDLTAIKFGGVRSPSRRRI